MAQETAQEKTEQPTPKRLKESRDKGQVARSRDLNTMTVLIAAAGGFFLLGDGLIQGLLDIMRDQFQLGRNTVFDTNALMLALRQAITDGLIALLPFIALMLVASLAAPLALGGWAFSAKAFAFKTEKLNPVEGMKRIFSARGLMEMFKALGKFAVIAAVLVVLLWKEANDFIRLGDVSIERGLGDIGYLLIWSFLILSSALIVIAAIDVPFQLWEHIKQLRMTRQEIKDEHKETDGSPEVRGRIRGLQREIAQRRMMAEVPKADVIVTNPTHFAVALRYDQDTMNAPVVVASGVDLMATQIRYIAHEHNVPILSAPSLARALYFSTEINHPIPAGLYLAVAQVLAYIFQLRTKPRRYDEPLVMDDLPIPEDLRKD